MAATDKKLTDDPIVLRIFGLLKKRNKKERNLAQFLGLQDGAIAKWKYYNGKMYLKYINQICEYLDTTPNYLFCGDAEKEDEWLTPKEWTMIRMYRSLDDERKEYIQNTLKYISSDRKQKQK